MKASKFISISDDEVGQLSNRLQLLKSINDLTREGIEDYQFAFCILEIDHFKRYIDFHGRKEGEHCLQQIEDCMKVFLNGRQGEIGRLSEEKFVCTFMDISRDTLGPLMNNMSEAIENLNLNFCCEQHSFHITSSVGGVHGVVSQFKDMAEMLVIAEEELYQAKSTGYNNVKIKFK
ncbi:diguanylate cyclase domain-containing protein [Psychrobacillus sp. FSL K6-1464]|uniref:diguanylate cyclase domain-containing protein n=1 Tax=Psychrobacillus sp. FSL K6-1464 TaxID=2921545 RepID=UPI0030F4F9C6